MTPGKRRHSAATSRRLSRKADSAIIGSHHVPKGAHAKSSPAQTGDFDGRRQRSRKGSGSYVEAVNPQTRSAETPADYSRRMRSGDYVEQARRQSVRRRRTVIITVVAAVLLVGIAVGVFTYYSTMDARMALNDAGAASELVEAEEGPRFALCVAALGTAVDERDPKGDAYELVRVDADGRTLTFVDIPSSIYVTTDNSETMPLYEVRSKQGVGALIREISDFADVDVNEFVYTDAAGIAAMAGAAAGVSFDVTEMIDDPRAGTIVLDAGEASLDGEKALLVLRALNFQKPYEQRSFNRASFTMQLLNQLIGLHGSAQAIADLAPSITSSASTSELLDLADSLGKLSELTVYNGVVPGQATSDGRYAVSSSAWQAMMEAVRDGRAPADTVPLDTGLNPAAITIEVRNGGGMTGAAASVGDILRGQGYNITYVGNMEDGAVYDETFVVYRDSAFEGAANVVQSQIGVGRVINGGDFYAFGTNLLVVVGKDYVVPS